MFDFPSPASEGQSFSPSGGPQYVYTNGTWRMQGAPYQSSLQSTAADMSIGFRTTPNNRFVVNDGPSLNGTDVGFLTDAGNMAITGQLTAGASVIGANYFISSTANAYLAPTGAGTISLRPNGFGSATGQTTIDSAGFMTVGGGAAITGAASIGITLALNTGYSATGANYGSTFNTYWWRSSATGTGATALYNFYNANGNVGGITVSTTTTAYATTSDARLKEFKSAYDPAEAIAIIRADPVKSFTWKTDGKEAIGWFAQDSHAVHPDLAVPPDEKSKEEGEDRWGIDYGRRTPYLWAALTAALDKIDALEARLALLEGAT